MTNTEAAALVRFASWLRVERQVVGEDVDIEAMVSQYLVFTAPEPREIEFGYLSGPTEFRHTICTRCDLDVEVELVDGTIESCQDRGGCYCCPDARFGPALPHEPAL